MPILTFALFALSTIPSLIHLSIELWFHFESILSAILIVQMVVLGDRFPWAWIQWKWVRFVGTVSYSWYLYNAIGSDEVNHSFLGHTVTARAGPLAELLMACASYYIVERPFLILKSKYEVRAELVEPPVEAGVRPN